MGLQRIVVSEKSLFSSVMAGLDADFMTFLLTSMFGTLNWTITVDQSWATCAPALGVNTGETDIITVMFSVANLAPGQYAANITISDAGAANNPVVIPVTLNITEVPALIEVDNARCPKFVTSRVQSVVPENITRPVWVEN